jgi:ParB/RepB/Spo0J family partition protein
VTVMATPAVAADTSLHRIPIDVIEPGPNARGTVGDVAGLAANLRAVGQLMPILVEPLSDGRYQLLDGHRRHAAANLAGIEHLTAVVRRADSSDIRRTVRQLSIQAHAQPFDPMAEARALHTLMFERNMAREDIARLVGKSPAWVRDRISLVHLTPGEQRDVQAGRMSVSEALFRLANRRAMREGRTPTQQRRTTHRTTPKTRPASTAAEGGRPGQIAALLADGASVEDIAGRLHVSVSTVKTYMQELYQRLGARNAAHAVHLAYQQGMLSSPGCGRCTPGKATAE